MRREALLLPTVRVGDVFLWRRFVDASEVVLRVPMLVCAVGRMLPIGRHRNQITAGGYRSTVKVRRTLRSSRSASDCGSTIILACPRAAVSSGTPARSSSVTRTEYDVPIGRREPVESGRLGNS